MALAFGRPAEAAGALGQLTINVIGLILAGVGSLWLGQRLSQCRAIAEIQSRRMRQRTARRVDD